MSIRFIRRLLTAVGATVVAACFALSPLGPGGADSGPDDGGDRPGEHPEGAATSADDEVSRQQRTEAGVEMRARVGEILGGDVGVLGWDDGQDVYVVRATAMTGDREERIRRVADDLGLAVRIEEAFASRDELRALQEDVEDRVARLLPPGIGWSVGLDLDTQRVAVTVDISEDAVLADLERELLSSALELDADRGLRARGGERSDRDLFDALLYVALSEGDFVDWREQFHLRGGEWLVVRQPWPGTDMRVCTSGFLFRQGSQFRMSTAGHCSRDGNFEGMTGGAVWFSTAAGQQTGLTGIGSVTHNRLADGGTDVALFSLPSTSSTYARVTTSAGTFRPVTGERDPSEMNHNDSQCFVGWGIHKHWDDDEKCGPLKKEGITVHPAEAPAGYTLDNLWCLERRTIGGDSGGPIFYKVGSNAEAAGTMVFSLKETPPFTTTKWYACYHVIEDIEAATGYTLVTNHTPPPGEK